MQTRLRIAAAPRGSLEIRSFNKEYHPAYTVAGAAAATPPAINMSRSRVEQTPISIALKKSETFSCIPLCENFPKNLSKTDRTTLLQR